MTTQQSDQTLKKDAGKAPMSLLPYAAEKAIAEVLAYGARKYAPHGWRRGMDWSRLLDAARRHLGAFTDGENLDPETGLSHLAHLGCCVMFLLEYQAKGLGTDDRFNGQLVDPFAIPYPPRSSWSVRDDAPAPAMNDDDATGVLK